MAMLKSKNGGYLLAIVLLFTSCTQINNLAPEDPEAKRRAVFEEGYRKLQRLAREAPNEHLAFFVEWKDGVAFWANWREGTRAHVSFPPEWIPTLCSPRIQRAIVAHTHLDELPPSEVDVGLMWSLERELESCETTVSQIVITPTTTWELSPLVPDEAGDRCRQYGKLFENKRTPYVQRDIEKVARTKGGTMLVTYYRCAVGIKAHFFEQSGDTSLR